MTVSCALFHASDADDHILFPGQSFYACWEAALVRICAVLVFGCRSKSQDAYQLQRWSVTNPVPAGVSIIHYAKATPSIPNIVVRILHARPMPQPAQLKKAGASKLSRELTVKSIPLVIVITPSLIIIDDINGNHGITYNRTYTCD